MNYGVYTYILAVQSKQFDQHQYEFWNVSRLLDKQAEQLS